MYFLTWNGAICTPEMSGILNSNFSASIVYVEFEFLHISSTCFSTAAVCFSSTTHRIGFWEFQERSRGIERYASRPA